MINTKNTLYHWESYTENGKKLSGDISAPTKRLALLILSQQGVQNPKLTSQKISIFNRIRKSDVTLFLRELSGLLKSGIPILQCCGILAKSHPNKLFKPIILNVQKHLENGYTLKQALMTENQYFDSLTCHLIDAAECSGALDDGLAQISQLRDKNEKILSQIKSSLFYPACILSFSSCMLLFMLTIVVPKFSAIFKDFGGTLPLATRILIQYSNALSQHGFLLIFFLFLLTYFIYKTKKFWKKLLFKLPFFKKILIQSIIARITRTLGTCLSSGLPLHQALAICAQVTEQQLYTNAIIRIKNHIESGFSLPAAFQATEIFSEKFCYMLTIAEQSGRVDEMLISIAKEQEEQVDLLIKNLSKLVEPAMIIILGGLIGLLVITLYLPIFQLGGAI